MRTADDKNNSHLGTEGKTKVQHAESKRYSDSRSGTFVSRRNTTIPKARGELWLRSLQT